MMTDIHTARAALHAYGLHLTENIMDRFYGTLKRAIYKTLPSTVVEIGPGTGPNLRYYPPNTRIIAIEPNRAMHAYLKSKAQKYNLNLTIKSIRGEQIDLPDHSIQAVVGTLVLCTVDDPARVLSEIRRILVPGGSYIYLEHVAYGKGTPLRRLQERLFPIWHWIFEGCHLNRSTHRAIKAAGFRRVEMDRFTIASHWLPLVPFAPHIFGRAVN